MLNELRFGQEVTLWPAAGLRVVMGPGGQDLPVEGAAVIWSEWWYARALEGAVHFHDPRPPRAELDSTPPASPAPIDTTKTI